MDEIETNDEWQGPIVLAQSEVWQCDAGVVELATGAAPQKGLGVKLMGQRLDAIQFSAGVSVFCRTRNGGSAHIVRMPV